MWYIHSSPTHHHVDVSGGETKDNCDTEWGVINNKYYKWPLYHTRQKRGIDDGDLFADYLHKFFYGDIDEKCTPLVNQIPIDILNRADEEFEMLTTILLPLTTMEHCIPYDRLHTMDEKDNVIELVDTQVFCCRGIRRTCICLQSYGKVKKLSFKKVPHNELVPVRGIYLKKWPYPTHNPMTQDQLYPIIQLPSQVKDSVSTPTNRQELEEGLQCTCSNHKYVDQECFYQRIMLMNDNHVKDKSQ